MSLDQFPYFNSLSLQLQEPTVFDLFYIICMSIFAYRKDREMLLPQDLSTKKKGPLVKFSQGQQSLSGLYDKQQ